MALEEVAVDAAVDAARSVVENSSRFIVVSVGVLCVVKGVFTFLVLSFP